MDDEKGRHCIVMKACRINHSCETNSESHWNERLGRNTIHALRDIQKGKETTRYYLSNNDDPLKDRQKTFKNRYRVDFECPRCSLTDEKRMADDRWVMQLHDLRDQIRKADEKKQQFLNPLQIFHLIRQEVRILKEKLEEPGGPHGGPTHIPLAVAYVSAARVALVDSDTARARCFLEKMVSIYSTV